MVRATTLLAATAALALNAHAESMYSKKSGVLSLTGMDYDRLIAKSNYTSVSAITHSPPSTASNNRARS
jgi:protein disulfide-isomerase A6